AVELEAFGTRGRVLAQIIEQARNSGESLDEILKDVSRVSIPDSEIQQLAREKAEWDKLKDSVEAATVKLEGWIATHLKAIAAGTAGGVAGTSGLVAGGVIGNFIHNPGGAPATLGIPTLTGGLAQLTAQAESEQAKLNADLLKRAEIIKAGGVAQYELNQAEKAFAEAVKNNIGADAERYAKQIQNLQQVISLEQQREQIWKSITKQVLNLPNPTLPKNNKPYGSSAGRGVIGSTSRPAFYIDANGRRVARTDVNPIFGSYGSTVAPDLGNPLAGYSGNASDLIASVAGLPSSQVIDTINKEHDDLFTSQFEKDKQHHDEELDAL